MPSSKTIGLSSNAANAIKSATTDVNTVSGAAPSSGQVLTATSSTTATWQTPAGIFSAMAIIEDQKTAGTAGGTFTSGAWRTRDLNTEVSDSAGIVSISSNQFTLGAGTYLIKASAPANTVSRHKAALYNVTDASYAAYGTSEFAWASDNDTTRSKISAVITIAGSKAFEIRHQCETTAATYGFGFSSNFSVTEIYTRVEIYKFS